MDNPIPDAVSVAVKAKNTTPKPKPDTIQVALRLDQQDNNDSFECLAWHAKIKRPDTKNPKI